ncbi:MAG TPA: tetratricopeptide repeat protein, partial [Pyrinomonadaceae bacterium]|nr:tetratricopeptide repeat protein [Pyrinomonadaceae bacterium]
MRILITLFARSLHLLLLLVSVVIIASAQQSRTSRAESVAQALELYRQGDVGQAITQLDRITGKRPNDVEAWEALATVLQREGMFGRVRPALERLIVLRPDAGDIRAQLAYVYILANDHQRAISEAERALELGNQSAEAHYALAEGHLRSGTFAKSLTEAELALSIKPDFVLALITKSMAHSALQQYREAAASLERVLAITSNDIDADVWRGQIEELALRAAEAPSAQSLAGSPVFTGKEVTQKARVTSKPEPSYTEPARLAGVQGTIVLRAVF